jgi:hypothetical protein
VAVVLGPSILVCGGLTAAGSIASIVRLDPTTGTVTRVGRLAVPVHDAGAAVIDGEALVVGGGWNGPGVTVQATTSSGSSRLVGHLPSPRADLGAIAIDGRIVVVGGGTPTHLDPRILSTSDGRAFQTAGRLVVPVRYPAAALVGDSLWVAGGVTGSGDSRVVEVFDTKTGLSRIAGHLPHPLSHASAFDLGGTVIVAGGRWHGLAQREIWAIDPVSGRVTTVGRLPYPISDAASAVLDGTGYLIGGEGSGSTASIVTLSVE